MHKFKYFILFSLLFSSLMVQANDWRKIHIRSAEGVDIGIHYQVKGISEGCYNCDYMAIAAPMYINVYHPDLRPTDQVHVIFKSYGRENNSPYESEWVTHVDGEWKRRVDGGGYHFTKEFFESRYNGRAPLTIFKRDSNGETHYRQQFEITINNNSLINPDNGHKSFYMKMFY